MATTTVTDTETLMELRNSEVKKKERLTFTSRPTVIGSGSEKKERNKPGGGVKTRKSDFGFEKYGGTMGIVLALPAIKRLDNNGQSLKTTTKTRTVMLRVSYKQQLLFKKAVSVEKSNEDPKRRTTSDVVSDKTSIRKDSCNGNGNVSGGTSVKSVSSPRRVVGDRHCNPEVARLVNNVNGKRTRKSESVSDVGMRKQGCNGNGSGADNVKSVIRQCKGEDRQGTDVNKLQRRRSDIVSDLGMRSQSCCRNKSGADDNVKTVYRFRRVGRRLCKLDVPQGNGINGKQRSKSELDSGVMSIRKQNSYRNGSVRTDVKSVSTPRHGGERRCIPEDCQGNVVKKQQRSKCDLVSDARMQKQDYYRNRSGATNVQLVSCPGHGDRQCNPNPQTNDTCEQRSKSEPVSDVMNMRKQSCFTNETGATNAKSDSSQRHVADHQCNIQGRDINRQQKRKSGDLVPDLGMRNGSCSRNEPCVIKPNMDSSQRHVADRECKFQGNESNRQQKRKSDDLVPELSMLARSCYRNEPCVLKPKMDSSQRHVADRQCNPDFQENVINRQQKRKLDLASALDMRERSSYRNEPCAIKAKMVPAPDFSIRKRSCSRNGPSATNAKLVSAPAQVGERQHYSDPRTVICDLDVQQRRKPDLCLTRDASAARDRHIQQSYKSETPVSSFACGSNEVRENTADDKQMTNSNSLHVEMLKKRYADTIWKAERQLAGQGNVKCAQFTFQAEFKVLRETEREAARRKIREMKKTVDIDGDLEAMRDLANMIGPDQVYLGHTHYELYDFNTFFRPCW